VPPSLRCGDAGARPATASPDRKHRRPPGRSFRRHLAVGTPIDAGLPPRTLSPGVLLGCRDRGARAVDLRPADSLTASLMHDFGLTRIPRNTMCFEVEGGEIARRFLERRGLSADDADRVAIAIILHMQPSVTLGDGVEAVLLDRATSLDVRGAGYALVDAVRSRVTRAFPRGEFDRRFLAAIAREAAIRPNCQSARLLHRTDLAGWLARSPWVMEAQP
jgi:hypothetical protein